MAGKTLHQSNPKDSSDPFNAGQMVGMLTVLTFIEERGSISDKMLQELKWTCATNASEFFQKPAEDVFLLINNLVKDIK